MVDPTPRATAACRRLCRSSELISHLDVVHHVLDPGVVLQRVRRQVLAVAGLLEPAVRHLGHQRDVAVDPHAAGVDGRRGDRKSTRLNSSHVEISYAVFCLKKKKKKTKTYKTRKK